MVPASGSAPRPSAGCWAPVRADVGPGSHPRRVAKPGHGADGSVGLDPARGHRAGRTDIMATATALVKKCDVPGSGSSYPFGLAMKARGAQRQDLRADPRVVRLEVCHQRKVGGVKPGLAWQVGIDPSQRRPVTRRECLEVAVKPLPALGRRKRLARLLLGASRVAGPPPRCLRVSRLVDGLKQFDRMRCRRGRVGGLASR